MQKDFLCYDVIFRELYYDKIFRATYAVSSV